MRDQSAGRRHLPKRPECREKALTNMRDKELERVTDVVMRATSNESVL